MAPEPAAGVAAYLRETAALLRDAADGALERPVAAAVDALANALRARRVVLICGNGGSAADAMHVAAEMVGRYRRERPGFRALALGADPAVTSAWSNDYDYADALARQVAALGEAGGVVWGFSTSGDSENVVRALRRARAMDMTALAMTGAGGGRLAGIAHILVAAPARDTPRVQEVHRCLYHYVCDRVEARLAAEEPAPQSPSKAQSAKTA